MTTSRPVDLESLIEAELPPLPDVTMRVAALTQDLNISTRAIADAIGCDPMLGARVLRAANSPLYYLERDITTLTMAVNALGNANVHLLMLASAAVDSFQQSGRASAIETTLWEHSIAVGLATREIMVRLGLRATEQGFICGLLHDIGKLMLLRYDPTAYRELISYQGEIDLLANERSVFGFTHAQVGALAASRWNLPDSITHAIYHHHQPGQAEDGMLIARVVDIADTLANQAGLGIRGGFEHNLAELESVIALQISVEQLNEIWEKTQADVAATVALFSR